MEPNNKQFLTEEELGKTQAMHTEFNKLKTHLADVSLQKHGLLKQIDLLRNDFAQHENELMAKYESNSDAGKKAWTSAESGSSGRRDSVNVR